MAGCRTFDAFTEKYSNKSSDRRLNMMWHPFFRLSTAMLFLLIVGGAINSRAVAQESSLQHGSAIDPVKHSVDHNGRVHGVAHPEIRQAIKNDDLDYYDVVIVTPGTKIAVWWDVDWELNNDGSCSTFLGTFDITSLPQNGNMTTGNTVVTDLGFAPCPTGEYTVNVLYYTAYGSALLGNNHDDQFAFQWVPDNPYGIGDSQAFPVGIATISAPSSVWWFGGVNPGSTTYPVSVNATVDIGKATNWYGGTYNWHLITGSDVVTLGPIDYATEGQVTTIAAAPPNSPNDVSIEVGMIVGDVFGHDVHMRTPPISLSVLEPYQTQKPDPADFMDFCDPYPSSSAYGYTCTIYYRTLDQNGKVLPPGYLQINENFVSQAIPYQPNNWVQGSACGPQHASCTSAKPQIWYDTMQLSGPPGSTARDTCAAPTCYPQPTRPINRNIPRTGVGVEYWPGEWRFGSSLPGTGSRVQTNNWTEYVDHGEHDNVVTPAP